MSQTRTEVPVPWTWKYQCFCYSDEGSFQNGLIDAESHGYSLHSWHQLYDASVGFGITAIFVKQEVQS